jgi:hypothetical protein
MSWSVKTQDHCDGDPSGGVVGAPVASFLLWRCVSQVDCLLLSAYIAPWNWESKLGVGDPDTAPLECLSSCPETQESVVCRLCSGYVGNHHASSRWRL